VRLATQAGAGWSDRARARGIRVAGFAIIFLAAGAALLPAGKSISSDMIGALLIAAGLIEAVAGSLRREVRMFAMAAGGVTALAGLLFLVNPETHFFPMVTPVIGWLLVRCVILAIASGESGGSVRMWISCSRCC
jgi:peptidoglycan/LPS O-acetylase OafA/YrhL